MLALTQPAEHSGRSLTITYETIPYLLHCSPGCSRLLNVILRRQEGIDDDHQHDRGIHEEVVHDRTGEQEVDYDHKEVVDQEEDGHGCLAVYLA